MKSKEIRIRYESMYIYSKVERNSTNNTGNQYYYFYKHERKTERKT